MNFIGLVERENRWKRIFQRWAARPAVVACLIVALLGQFGLWALAPQPALAFSSSWPFDTAGDYTVTANKIKVTGGQAQLGRTPDWWDTSYAYRNRITVTAGSTAITTSDTITLNTDAAALVTAGKMQADQDDLRIVYWNGSTNANIDRDYLASGLGAIAATPGNAPVNNDIRFKAQAAISASGSDTGYYVYYGNSGASAGPTNLANVYRYYEPFNSAGTWNLTNGATWSINSAVSGRLARAGGLPDTTDRFAADTGNGFSGASNWFFETTMRRTSGTNTVSIAATAAIPEATAKGYRLTTFGASANDMELWSRDGNISQGNTPVDYGTFTITTGTDYRMTMRYQTGTCPTGIRVSGWLDGTTRHDRTDMTRTGNSNNCAGVASNWNASTVMYPGVHVWNENASYDDYKVWQYLNESVALGGEETVYPSDDPTVQPTTAVTFDRLDSFTETSTLNGGSIRYVLSNDGGTTWLYQNGTSWVSSNSTFSQATTAANINTNATSFPTGSRSLLWRAFLRSDGTQLVQLDTVSVNGNRKPNAPTLTAPANGTTVSTVTPTLQLSATDDDSDAVRYVLQLDTSSAFNTGNLLTYNQATSQTGWSGQNALSGTGYTSGTTANFTFPSSLNAGITYYWRVQAVDPNGVNTSSAYSATGSFVAPGSLTATGIQASTITTTSAIILWTTSNAATSKVEYGTTTAYGSTATLSGTRTSHQVALSSLANGTLYHYRVTGTDLTGQSYTSTDQTFTTLGPTVITGVAVTPLTSRSVRVTWTTNHAADSKVRYGTSTNYGSEVYDATRVTSHSVDVTGLTPGTTYHYEVLSVGNTSTNDADATFVAPPDAPTILEPITDAVFTTAMSVPVVGLAGSGQTVTVYVDGAKDGTTTAATSATGTGSFGYTLKTKLTVGTHAITVTGTTNGNVSPASAARIIMVTGPSVAPTVLPPVVQDGTNPTVTIRGLARANSRVDIIVDGRVVKSVTVPNSSTGVGSFAATISTAKLKSGSHTVQVIAYDDNDTPSKVKTATTFEIKGTSIIPKSKRGFSHIVQGGESLWQIAQEVYGDGRKYLKLVTANQAKFPTLAVNPSLIRIGWVLQVPR